MDPTALGRLAPGQGPAGPRRPLFRRRRRRRWLLPPVVALAVFAGPMLLTGTDTPRQARTEAATAPVRSPVTAVPEIPAVFARAEGLALHLPSAEVLLIGYHEASLPEALPLAPVGYPSANHNRTRFTPPPAESGPGYVVLSSRGRPHPATSAVDVVLRDGDPVRSLVSGSVAAVRPYWLYGQHADTRIELVPQGRGDLRVVIIHVTDVRVRAGDAVVAGETVLAGSANRFPFASHIDRFFPRERWPHIHVEVKRAGPPGRP